MIQVWRSPLVQQEGRISGLCTKTKLATHHGATTQLCLSPSFVWSRPCICRRNAPPSCWTWRSSRWCSRCRRRRCRPCVGCTWRASLSCKREWRQGRFRRRAAPPINKTKNGARFGRGGKKGEFGLGTQGGKWKDSLWKEWPADSELPRLVAPTSSKRFFVRHTLAKWCLA